MDFTREPIIETVITPKEGYKLVIRNSKGVGQEEHFVDAVEVVSFGAALFFRSTEKPKPFLVPVSDYEVLEVREARMVLKYATLDRSIRIGGGRDSKEGESKTEARRERQHEKTEEDKEASEEGEGTTRAPAAAEVEPRGKRDRRRNRRRRGGREESRSEETEMSEDASEELAPIEEGESQAEPPIQEAIAPRKKRTPPEGGGIPKMIPPPEKLISESLGSRRPSPQEGRTEEMPSFRHGELEPAGFDTEGSTGGGGSWLAEDSIQEAEEKIEAILEGKEPAPDHPRRDIFEEMSWNFLDDEESRL